MDNRTADLLKKLHDVIDCGEVYVGEAFHLSNALCCAMMAPKGLSEPLLNRLKEAIGRHDIKEAHRLADELANYTEEEKNKPIFPPQIDKPRPNWLTRSSWLEFGLAVLIVGLIIALVLILIEKNEDKAREASLASVAVKAVIPEEICNTDEQRELIKKYPPENYWLLFEKRGQLDDLGKLTVQGYFIYPIGKTREGKIELTIRMEQSLSNDAFIQRYQRYFICAYTIHDWNTGQLPRQYQYKQTIFYSNNYSDYGVIELKDGLRIICDSEVTWRMCDPYLYSRLPENISNFCPEDLDKIGGWVIPVPSASGKLGMFISKASGEPTVYVNLDRTPVRYYSCGIQRDEQVLTLKLAKQLAGFAKVEKFGDEFFVIIYPMRADYKYDHNYENNGRKITRPRYRLATDLASFRWEEHSTFEMPLKGPDRPEY